ncbi:hypothetical protein NEHOM01_0433 [Nematocida homosporus]|uniref:uncharacterized protein n=1 Tax=Nematocida homosporus TaxID=1912981 RepID=UPI00221E8A05|nr:uncharacterized protein NEHOM01_0433 [Nematocida homosporus]KAI5184831.1 hypothetical protein NEHOM01_0433 [Nematocida homosporus]
MKWMCVLMRVCYIYVGLGLVMASADANSNPSSIQPSPKLIAALTEFGIIDEETEYSMVAPSDSESSSASSASSETDNTICWDLKFNPMNTRNAQNTCFIILTLGPAVPIQAEVEEILQQDFKASGGVYIKQSPNQLDIWGIATDKNDKAAKTFLNLLRAMRLDQAGLDWIDKTEAVSNATAVLSNQTAPEGIRDKEEILELSLEFDVTIVEGVEQYMPLIGLG